VDARELAAAGIARQAALIREREVSPRELVQACLERIELLDPRLGAFRSVYRERALADAEDAERALRDAGSDAQPLLGVPVAIKDDTDVAGDVTPAGTRAHGGPAEADAEVVARLRAAGAIPIGKTHVPELIIWPFTESSRFGITRNPWDLERSPGGSSGGSAAAVAAGLVGGALGSDGAGSIRIPASCCGIFGLKPGRGRVPIAPKDDRDGGWHGLGIHGPLVPSVADAAVFLDATADGSDAGSFVRAAASGPGRLRIAVSTKLPPGMPALLGRLHPEVRGATEATADALGRLGHRVVGRDPEYGGVMNNLTVRFLRGVADSAAAMPRPERLERRTRATVRLGRAIHPSLLARERAAEGGHAARLNRLFAEYDVLLTPVLTTPPVEVARWEGQGALRTLVGVSAYAAYTPPWNATGQPAAAVPAGVSSSGLPIGVQLVGRPGAEATLLSLSAELEAERPWSQRLPAEPEAVTAPQ
jgi:amidase